VAGGVVVLLDESQPPRLSVRADLETHDRAEAGCVYGRDLDLEGPGAAAEPHIHVTCLGTRHALVLLRDHTFDEHTSLGAGHSHVGEVEVDRAAGERTAICESIDFLALVDTWPTCMLFLSLISLAVHADTWPQRQDIAVSGRSRRTSHSQHDLGFASHGQLSTISRIIGGA